ncbi:MAG: hypothetical protein M1837_007463 [Sclerophora amabilis]|nr:MAG: hypothetical protein M1837_007463 [Sclerophora amabilis]
MKTSTVVAASVGTVVTGLVAYAAYFDYRRRSDPNFRKALKRDARRQARAAKEEAVAHSARQKDAMKAAMNEARDEGFPTDVEEKEAYFMNEVAKGEGLCADGSDSVHAALCFYKALKVYPQPRDLITIYDKTVPKPVLDILAEMIAADPTISVGPIGGTSSTGSGGPSSDSGAAVE